MTSRTDTARSLPARQAIGEQLRALRDAVGFTQAQVADLVGFSQCSVSYIERADRDVLLSTAVDVAAVYGRHVVVAAEHHLPLLDLTADEVRALREAARMITTGIGYGIDDATLATALDKLTTTEEG